MMQQGPQKALRLGDRTAVAGPIDGMVEGAQLFQQIEIEPHGAVRRSDDGGRPAHDVVAGEQGFFLDQFETDVVHGVAGRPDRAQRVARAFKSLAVGQLAVGAMVEVVGGVELVDLAQGHVARRKMRRATDDLRARCLLQQPRGGRMVAMGVGNENRRDRFALQTVEQSGDMGGQLGAGVDDRHLAFANT